MSVEPMRSDGPGVAGTDPSSGILQERARRLARPVARALQDEGAILTFTVAGSRFAVEVGEVREVLAGADISRLPWAPPALAGVTNVRGAVVLVADTARLLGLGEPGSGTAVVLLDGGGRPLGLLVDAVDDVIPIAAGSLVPPPDDVRPSADLVLGVTPTAVVLDATALRNDPRLANQFQENP